MLLSLLLGNDPPRSPVGRLVRTTELFGIAPGTARTALSRMVASGELRSDDGWYELASPSLLARHRRQDESRRAHPPEWDGRTWRQFVLTPARARPAADRTAMRQTLRAARFAELREGVWLRPADERAGRNVVPDEVTVFDVVPHEDPRDLVRRLWDLPSWTARAHVLIDRMDGLADALDAHDHAALAPGFVTSAAVLRHVQADPLLPTALLPDRWPGARLRERYERYDAAYRAVLAAWFRSDG